MVRDTETQANGLPQGCEKLTLSQQAVYLDQLMHPQVPSYNIGTFVDCDSRFDEQLIRSSLSALPLQHAFLRVVLKKDGDEVYQQVKAHYEPQLEIVDFSSLPNAAERAEKYLIERDHEVYDLYQSAWRVVVVKLADHQWKVMICGHHLFFDGLSIISIFERFMENLERLSKGEPFDSLIQICDETYWDYVREDQNYLESYLYKKDKKFWQEKFTTVPDCTLPAQSVADESSHKSTFERIYIPRPVYNKLEEGVFEYGYSMAHFSIAVIASYYAKLKKQNEIVIGIPVHNRMKSKYRNTIGMFASIMPIRLSLDKQASFLDLLAQISKEMRTCFRHQRFPIAEINRICQLSRLGRHQIFDISVSYEKKHIGSDYSIGTFKGATMAQGYESTPAALAIKDIYEHDDVGLELNCNSLYIEPSEVINICHRLRHMMVVLSEDLDVPIADIPVVLPEEQTFQVQELNREFYRWKQSRREHEPLVHELFLEQARKHPEHPAVEYRPVDGVPQRRTYIQLQEDSERVARCLIDQSVAPGSLVGFYMERQADLFAVILGILRAGCGFLPLSIETPVDRVNQLLKKTQSPLIVVDDECDADLFSPVQDIQVMLLSRVLSHESADYRSLPEVSGDQLAYVTFTSGSTGEPKGVKVTHNAILSIYQSWASVYQLRPTTDRMLQMANVNFDVFTGDWTRAFCSGNTLVLCDRNRLLAPEQLYRELVETEITVAEFVPAVLRALSEHLVSHELVLPPLRLIMVGSDSWYPHDSQQLFSVMSVNTRLVNSYGVTETTVDNTWFDIDRDALSSDGMTPIGKPFPNTCLYILDEFQQCLPLGEVGELYIGGAGVSQGYLNQPDLTAEKFLVNPYLDDDSRYYRTGDMVRFQPDGTIEYIGRSDHQVKVNGYRIELAEIEDQLSKLELVKHAVVTGNRNKVNNVQLVAYLEGQPDADLTDSSIVLIKEQLGEKLPKYMIPSVFMVVDAWPISANGKVDRKALPEPDLTGLSDVYVPPESPAEKVLTGIWAELFNLDETRLSVHSNFFELGGDSILSIQVISRAAATGLRVTIKQIYEHQSIAQLARQVDGQSRPLADQSAMSGTAPLLPIQAQFFDDETELHHYNQSVLLTTHSAMERDQWQQIVTQLYQRHDAFRLRFQKGEAGQWQALYSDIGARHIADSLEMASVETGDASEIEALCNQVHQSLSITEGPLIRFLVIQPNPAASNDEAQSRLFIAAHHLIIDAVSWRILVDDISTLIDQRESGQEMKLNPKTDSYQVWGQFLHAQAESLDLSYWDRLSEITPERLFERSQPTAVEEGVKHCSFEFDGALTEQLLRRASTPYRTHTDELLMAALYLALYRLTGSAAFPVDIEHHGRDLSGDRFDFSQTIGWFTSLYPHVLSAPKDFDWNNLESLVCQVKESLREVPEKGLGYGLRRFINQDPSIDVRSEIVFNYLGQFDQTLRGSRFTALEENFGEVVSPLRKPDHGIEINGWVKNDQLRFELGYDASLYDPALIESFVGHFRQAVTDIVGFCSSLTRSKLTPSDLPLCEISMAELDEWQTRYNRGEQRLTNVYPATEMQKGMLFHSLFDKANYHTQLLIELEGEFKEDLFREAWQKVMDRHDALRTNLIDHRDGYWYQLVLSGVQLPWHFEDLTALSDDEQHRRIEQYRRDDKQSGFDLSGEPLLRIAVWKTRTDRHQVLWSQHHVVSDGWSMPLIMSDLMSLYHAGVYRQPDSLPAAPAYGDFIEWQQQCDFSGARHYWQTQLSDFEGPTALPGQRGHELAQNQDAADFAHRRVALSPEQTQRLVEFARSRQTTVNTILQAAWAYILASYSHESRVTFGLTTSGRPPELPEVERIVGLFINTLPVTIHVDGEQSLSSWLKQLHQDQVERQEFSYLPFSEIGQLVEKDPHTPLFNSLLVFENYPSIDKLDRLFEDNSLTVTSALNDEETSFALTLIVTLDEALTVDMSYLADAFDHQIIAQVQDQLLQVVQQFCAPETNEVSSLELITPQQRREIVTGFNDTERAFSKHKSMVQLFEEQVARSPEQPAVVFEDEVLNYRQLNERANRLAAWLEARGVTSDTPVGLACYRSLEMVVGIWGILKAGGAYVPMEPDYPAERLQDIADVSGLGLVLTHAPAEFSLPEVPSVLLDDDAFLQALQQYPGANRESASPAPDDLAYILFTSGSTGKPKGVMIEHRALVNRIEWMQNQYGLTNADAVLQKTPFSFDVSVWEFTWPLITGARLVVARPEGHKDPQYMQGVCEQERITTLHFVPSMLKLMLESGCWHRFDTIRHVFCSGEALTSDLVEAHYSQHGAALHNLYGPTEAAIDVSYYPCVAKEPTDRDPSQTVSIGKPIQNLQLYVLGRHQQLLPVGAVGELYIGGVGLARGYVNRSDLTRERFVTVSLTGDNPIRLYRTGDLARQRADGNIDYLGRIDDQVKIRGQRIELTEIQEQLQSLDNVVSAAVTVQRDAHDQPQIVAYIVPARETDFDADSLSKLLGERLPCYMVPSRMVPIGAIPLSPNGKLNRRALPAVTLESSQQIYIAPRGQTAQRLTQLWAQVLHRDSANIGAQDDFFKLGGHSLLAIRLMSELRSEFTAKINIRAIYEHSQLQQQADHIDQILAATEVRREGEIVASDWSSKSRIPASFAQQRLWFLNRLGENSSQYHMFAAIDVRGDFDPSAAQWALTQIVKRHPLLQARYHNEGEQVYLSLEEPQDVNLARITCQTTDEHEMRQGISQEMDAFVSLPFDLEHDQLLRAAWVSTASDAGILLLNMHHIAFDGWSMSVLADEFQAFYLARVTGKSSDLVPLPLSYFDYAASQREFLTTTNPEVTAQLDYWRSALSGIPNVHGLPTDFPREPNMAHVAGYHSLQLSKTQSDRLNALAQQQQVSLYMLMHAAFSLVLSRYANETDIVMGMPVAGRLQKAFDSVIGMFVNTLVLRVDCHPEQRFTELLQAVRETHLNAQENQDIPFEWLVEALSPNRSTYYSPIIQVMLSMNNTQPIDLSLPDLDVSLHDGFRYQQALAGGETSTDVLTKFELLLNVEEMSDGLNFTFEYSRALWLPETIERVSASLEALLDGLMEAVDQHLYQLPLSGKAPLPASNEPKRALEAQEPVHKRFEQIVEQFAQFPALISDGEALSYTQFNQQANRLARHLQTLGAGPGSTIGVCMTRSPELYLCLLAILKTGGAYVPLDAGYPAQRLDYMLADSEVGILLHDTERFLAQPLEGVACCHFPALQPLLDNYSAENLSVEVDAQSLAYINYTSGSTGQPKGVMTPHRGITRLVTNPNFMPLDESTRFLQMSSVSFDAATLEIWGALLNGGRLVLYPDQAFDIERLNSLINREQINSLWLTSALFDLWSQSDSMADAQSLRWVLAGGDVVNPRSVKQVYESLPHVEIINGYGPTENTTFTCCYTIPRNHPQVQPIPLGQAVSGTKVYVLDAYQQPLPEGAVGELYAAGAGVALGYLNQAALTAERFIPNPQNPAETLYRTGDLVRLNHQQQIEFIGRADQQVKIRGFRIEPSEIELTLESLAQVRSAVVVVHDDDRSTKELAAYLVLNDVSDVESAINAVRTQLKEKLPAYMVPAYLMSIASIPVTVNGKVDKAALPDISAETSSRGERPNGPTEMQLAESWSRLLKVSASSVYSDNDFFEMGGHSLLSIKLQSDIRDVFEVEIPIITIFEASTLRSMAANIDILRIQQGIAENPGSDVDAEREVFEL